MHAFETGALRRKLPPLFLTPHHVCRIYLIFARQSWLRYSGGIPGPAALLQYCTLYFLHDCYDDGITKTHRNPLPPNMLEERVNVGALLPTSGNMEASQKSDLIPQKSIDTPYFELGGRMVGGLF